ncbi:MAG: DUF6691 family protein [Hyphomicrobiaceae bacterium]
MRIISAFCIGLLFGFGILLSGMGNPAKVANFFDIAGSWDPSLAFVMGGALIVTAIGYRIVLDWPAPLLERNFSLPTATKIDIGLLAGSATFGIGWGLTGFCPGGLIPVLAIGRVEPIVFLAGLIVGLIVTRLVRIRLAGQQVRLFAFPR